MKIKKYIVKTLSGLDDMVRRDLGPDAVILTVRKLKQQGIASWLFSDRLEVVAAIDENLIPDQQAHLPVSQEIEREWESPVQSEEESAEPIDNGKVTGTYLDPRFHRKHGFDPIPREAVEVNAENPVSADEYLVESGLKEMTRSLIKTFAFSAASQKVHSQELPKSKAQTIPQLNTTLQSLGIEYPFVDLIAEKLQERFGNQYINMTVENGELIDAVSQELVGRIPVSGPILLKKDVPTYAGIVGPSGAGKTTMLVKIAMQYIREARKRVALLAIESENHARIAELQIYADQAEIPLVIARDDQSIFDAFKSFIDIDLVLVDFPQMTTSDGINEWLKCFQDIELHLAFPAGIRISDAQEWLKRLQGMPIEALIITKTDETAYLGALPALCEVSGFPISYLSIGPKIPADIQIADPNVIAESIVSRGLLKWVETR